MELWIQQGEISIQTAYSLGLQRSNAPPQRHRAWPRLRRPLRHGLGADPAHEAVEGALEGAVRGALGEAPQQQILQGGAGNSSRFMMIFG